MPASSSRPLLALGLLVTLPAPLAAQQPPATGTATGTTAAPATTRPRPARVVSSRKPWVVSYDHLRETMIVRDADGDERAQLAGSALADAPVLRIPPDVPVEVRIENANPMLYAYDVTASVVQERRARGCRAVLGTFGQAALQFRALSLGELPAKFSVDAEVRQMLSAEGLAARGGPLATKGEMSAADRAAMVALVAERVAQYEDRAAELRRFTASFEDSLATVAELADATPAAPLLDSLAQSLRARIPAAKRSTDVALALRALAAEARQPATLLVQLSAGGEADARALRTRFDSALTTIATSYRRMQLQLQRVERYREATVQRWTLEPSGDYRAIRIRLDATRDFADVPRLRTGTVEALTNPSGRIACNLAPGIALAGAPRTYALRGDTVAKTSGVEQRTAASLLLHLDLAESRLPLGALAGVGLGSNRRPDWYLGGSFRLSDVVRVNGGWIWQREELLPGGHAVGDVLAPAERARFVDRGKGYRAGFFWGVSLAP